MSKVFTIPRIIVLAGLVIFYFAFSTWWRHVYSSPAKVFNRMLSSSLTASSVTRNITQSDQKTQSDQGQSLLQNMQYLTAPYHSIHSVSDLRQVNEASSNVVTETFSTPDENFLRYNHIETSQKNAEDKDFDFSSVVNVWANSSATEQRNSAIQMYSENLIIPFANLNPEQRKTLLNQIQREGVYEIDYTGLSRDVINRRPVYSYPVSIKPAAYINMLKTLAGFYGLKQLEGVNPDDYAKISPIKIQISVDVWSSQLTAVTYEEDDSKHEIYGSYGAKSMFAKPDSPILVEELQTRLQQIQ